ncbi:hypothetical protein ACX956_001278 [Proteus mirabilis]
MNFSEVLAEIQKERRSVGFDTYDITIKQLVDMIAENNINVSLVLFEAISIGVADILSMHQQVDSQVLVELLENTTLKELTTGATNSLPKLTGRINFVSQRAVI